MKTIEVKTRFASGTYHARENRPNGYKVTNTQGEDHAARALATKYWGAQASVLRTQPYPASTYPQCQTGDIVNATPEQRADYRNRGITHLIKTR